MARPDRNHGMLRVALAVAALASACGGPEALDPAEAELGPLRVVSLTPAASEFVVALEATHQLVGVDTESQHIPELASVPAVDFAAAAALAPDLALVPELPATHPGVAALRHAGIEVVPFGPHDLEDAFALCRHVGTSLVGEAAASAFEIELSRALAQIGGSSYGQPRPLVLALAGPAPLEIAGGHSFATDLIEIAGGRSLTHENEDWRVTPPVLAFPGPPPDLLLVLATTPASDAEVRAALGTLPVPPRVVTLPFDGQRQWTRDMVEAAERLRAEVAPVARELAEERAQAEGRSR